MVVFNAKRHANQFVAGPHDKPVVRKLLVISTVRYINPETTIHWSENTGMRNMTTLRTMAAAGALFLGLCIITSGKPTDPMRAYCKVIW